MQEQYFAVRCWVTECTQSSYRRTQNSSYVPAWAAAAEAVPAVMPETCQARRQPCPRCTRLFLQFACTRPSRVWNTNMQTGGQTIPRPDYTPMLYWQWSRGI